jgi:hypothetical protein
MSLWRRAPTVALWVFAALPAIFILVLILRYGLDFHYFDEWAPDIAGVLIKAHRGQLTFADLAQQHNEHRMLLPRLIFLAVAWLTDWDNRACLLTGWAILCLASGILFFLIRRTAPPERVVITFVFANLILFTPAQRHNILWGIGIANLLPVMLELLLVLVSLRRGNSWLTLIAVMAVATAATFTIGDGLLCWIFGGILLAWRSVREKWHRRISLLLIWIGGFAGNVIAYFHGYARPADEMHSHQIAQMAQFALAFLGNAFTQSTTYSIEFTSQFIGAVLLVLFTAAAIYFLCQWRNRRLEICDAMLPWLIVGAFSVSNAFLAAYARGGVGVGESIAARYVSSSLLLIVSLINLTPMVCTDLTGRGNRQLDFPAIRAPAVLGTILLILYAGELPFQMANYPFWCGFQRQLKGTLLLANVLPDNPQLQAIYYSMDVLRAEANALDEMGYLRPHLIHDSDVLHIRADSTDKISFVQGKFEKIFSPKPGLLVVSGWAWLPADRTPADIVLIAYRVDQQDPVIVAMANVKEARPDLLEPAGAQNCGWINAVQLSQLPKNFKSIQLSAWALDVDTGKAAQLEGVWTITN